MPSPRSSHERPQYATPHWYQINKVLQSVGATGAVPPTINAICTKLLQVTRRSKIYFDTEAKYRVKCSVHSPRYYCFRSRLSSYDIALLLLHLRMFWHDNTEWSNGWTRRQQTEWVSDSIHNQAAPGREPTTQATAVRARESCNYRRPLAGCYSTCWANPRKHVTV